MDPAPSSTSIVFANALLWVAAVFYLVAVIPLVSSLRRPVSRARSLWDHVPVALGLAAHVAGLVLYGLALGRLPLGNLAESAAFVAALLAASRLLSSASSRYPMVGLALMGLVVLFMGIALLVPRGGAAENPMQQRGWFIFHTLTAAFGLATLFLTFVASLLYLIEEHQLKAKRTSSLMRYLPPLVACDRLGYRLLQLGFPLFTVGVISGLLWASRAPGWSPGLKEVSFILSWCIYALLVHVRVVKGLSGRKAAVLAVACTVVATVAVFGIRL